jgi:hypothetical protein
MSDVEIFGNAVRQDLAVLGYNVNLVHVEMREGMAQLSARVWRTFCVLFVMTVVQTVALVALGWYTHECIRGNAECLRAHAECLRAHAECMKQPVCEWTPNPLCQASDSDCFKCWAHVNFQFVLELLKQ